MKFKTILILISWLTVIGISGYFGFFIGQSECQYCPAEEVDLSLFWEAYHQLEEKFVNKEKLDIDQMIYGAISGMVKSLGDPYTTFFNPKDTKTFVEDVKGSFQGVGMEIGIRKGQLQVIAPLEGTPAKRAGLRAGDKIMKVDETVTADLTIEEAVNLIRGERGTKVVLTIFRKEWDKTKEIEIIRDVINIPSMTWELKDNNIAYLKLYQFSEKAGQDFNQIALEILNSPAQKIILDLRNNPGGYLEISRDITGWFIEKGQIVVIEDFGGEKENKEYLAKGPTKFRDWPMVILINQGSASASEILAGALKYHRGNVMLIGEKSFGKGSVQELKRLKDGSSLKITIAKWLTPGGISISDSGLEPDIKIEITDEDFEQDRDPQLNKAIEIIKEIM